MIVIGIQTCTFVIHAIAQLVPAIINAAILVAVVIDIATFGENTSSRIIASFFTDRRAITGTVFENVSLIGAETVGTGTVRIVFVFDALVIFNTFVVLITAVFAVLGAALEFFGTTIFAVRWAKTVVICVASIFARCILVTCTQAVVGASVFAFDFVAVACPIRVESIFALDGNFTAAVLGIAMDAAFLHHA